MAGAISAQTKKWSLFSKEYITLHIIDLIIMRSVFSTATLFYFLATAVASQPDKLKLYGVPSKAAAASLAIQKDRAKLASYSSTRNTRKNFPRLPRSRRILLMTRTAALPRKAASAAGK
jgi:hypothetical protein